MTSILYSLFIVLAFVFAYGFLYLTSSYPQKTTVVEVIPISFVAAIFGALLYTIIVTAVQGHIQFGLSSLGAAIGYFVSILIYLKKKSAFNPDFLKKIALTLPMLYGISKMGCLIKGCCNGTLFGLEIQLIEVITFLGLFLICYIANTPYLITLLISSVTKTVLETFREGISIPSANQIVSTTIAMVVFTVLIKQVISNKKQKVV